MATYAQRRRARLLARMRRPAEDDPENAERQRGAIEQMAVFDDMPADGRVRLSEHHTDFDLVDHLELLQRAGPGNRARQALKARGLVACQLSLPELLALDLVD